MQGVRDIARNSESTVIDVVEHVHVLGSIGQNDLRRIVGPRTELEKAQLIVEGKPSDVDATGGSKFDDRRPEHRAIGRDHR